MDNPFKKLSKPQLYATVGGFVLISGYFVIHRHSTTGSWNPFTKSAAATTTGGNSIDPVTGLPYTEDSTVDPQTGETYLAEAQQYGSVTAAEASVSAYGQSTATGSGIPVNPASPASSGSINTPVGTSVYTSDAAWAQAVQAGLTDVGYSATDVAQALGLYLTQHPLTAAQAQLVNTGIAEYGPAPVGNLQVILAPPSSPSPVTTGSAPPGPGPSKPGGPSGITVSSVTSTGARVSWHASPGATSYTVHVTYQGRQVFNQTVTGTSVSVGGLTPDHTYTVHVAASNSAGSSPETGGPAFKTPK